MKNPKTLSTVVEIEEYNRVLDFIEIFNLNREKPVSLSKFVWGCIKFFMAHYKG